MKKLILAFVGAIVVVLATLALSTVGQACDKIIFSGDPGPPPIQFE